MKKICLIIFIFFITFNFQSLTRADDIRDFQIEGMSIGDSALDYFSESEINKNKKIGIEIKNFMEQKLKPNLKNLTPYSFILKQETENT